MTKFVLHGGVHNWQDDNIQPFFAELFQGFSGPIKLLQIYFAKPPEDWQAAFEAGNSNFVKFQFSQKIEPSLARLETFRQQVKEANVICVWGGHTVPLVESLRSFPDLLQMLDGKVYGGSSAGINVLAKYYYSQDLDAITEGLGLLPIKTFSHYNEIKKDKLRNLEEYGSTLDTYAIPEDEFIVLKY